MSRCLAVLAAAVAVGLSAAEPDAQFSAFSHSRPPPPPAPSGGNAGMSSNSKSSKSSLLNFFAFLLLFLTTIALKGDSDKFLFTFCYRLQERSLEGKMTKSTIKQRDLEQQLFILQNVRAITKQEAIEQIPILKSPNKEILHQMNIRYYKISFLHQK